MTNTVKEQIQISDVELQQRGAGSSAFDGCQESHPEVSHLTSPLLIIQHVPVV